MEILLITINNELMNRSYLFRTVGLLMLPFLDTKSRRLQHTR
jgi:hypothetical protein